MNLLHYQKTENPNVITVDSKTKEVKIKKLTGTYYRIVAPYNDRAHWVITCSEMHRDRFASADDSTMVISTNLRNQLLSL
jgi:hypothetical protein